MRSDQRVKRRSYGPPSKREDDLSPIPANAEEAYHGRMSRSDLDRRVRDRSIAQECSGACGDLGTFIPHVIGAMTVAGLAPAGVLFGFGLFLISTGLFYGLPLPVQPMKAVSAVIVTDGLRPGEVAAAGM